MKFPAKGGSDFEPVPAGNHIAICTGIVDFGLQPGSSLYPEPKRQVYLRFELPQERVDFERDGKKINGPMSIGRRFTASMSKKANLRKFIESWFGKQFPSDERASGFDLMDLLDKKCLLNVTHASNADRIYATISGASPIPRGMPANFKRENDALMYDLSESDDEAFAKLPQWMRELINKRLDQPKSNNGNGARLAGTPARISTTDTGLPTGNEPGVSFDDDIPF